jgi:hypothetical protein
MNAFLDKYSVAMTSLLIKDKWFEKSLSSKHLIDRCLEIPVVKVDKLKEEVKETNTYVNGVAFDAAYAVVKWLGYDFPTIIYHHGNNERPFDYRMSSKNTFKSVLYSEREKIQANLITIRAPFHQESLKTFTSKMKHLELFTGMLAVSTNLIEGLVSHLKAHSCPRVMVTGLSLGGWVVNLHRSVYNTADVYVPIFAGAALDRLFKDSYYRKLVSFQALENESALADVLNLEEAFKKISTKNVYPLLAKEDQFIEYEVQRHSYDSDNLKTINKGHITGALASAELREHILAHL